MAAKYRKIDPRIWGDEKFARLDGKGKLLALYCLTCPQGNRIGLFRFSPALAAEDLDTVCDTLVKTLDTVCDTMKWRFDQGARVLYFPTWWKYNHPDNAKHLTGCLDDLHDVPETFLIAEFAANLEYLEAGYREQFRNCIAYRMRNGMAYQEQEQEQEQNQNQEQDTPPNPQGGTAGDVIINGKHRKPRAAKADLPYSEDFETFWRSYSDVRKTNKPDAWKAWQEAIRTTDPQVIIQAAIDFSLSPVGLGEYCPGPAPWLRGKRWEDSRQSWQGARAVAKANDIPF